MYLNIGMQNAPNLNTSGVVPSTINHMNGLPQESKLATYISVSNSIFF